MTRWVLLAALLAALLCGSARADFNGPTPQAIVIVPAVCDGTIDDTATIQASLDQNPGKFNLLPTRGCLITATIRLSSNYTVLGTFSGASVVRNGGSQCASGPRLIWGGAPGETMVLAAPPVVPSTGTALVGAGIQGLALCANGSAGIGFKFKSLHSSKYEYLFVNEATEAAFDFDVMLASEIGDYTSSNNNTFTALLGNQVSHAAPIFRFRAQSVDGNTSKNTFIDLGGNYMNAPAILCQDADNNRFIGTHFHQTPGGTAVGIIASNDASNRCDANSFFDPGTSTGGMVLRGGLSITIAGTVTATDAVALTFASTDLPSYPTTVSYTVQTLDTATNIATGLKNAINANARLIADGFSATSIGAVVLVLPAGTKKGEVAMTYSQGGNTETVTTVPADGIMVGTITRNIIVGTDVNNNDPAPVLAYGARAGIITGSGSQLNPRLAAAILAQTGAATQTAQDRIAQLGKTPVTWEYDTSQFVYWTDNGVGLYRRFLDNLNNYVLQRQTSFDGGFIAPHVYTSTADASIATASETSCYGTGIGNQNSATGSVLVGTKYHLTCRGNYSTPGGNAATLTPKVKWGTTVIATGTAVAMPASATNFPFWLDVNCTLRSLQSNLSTTVQGTATPGDVLALVFTSSLPSFPVTVSYTVQGGDTLALVAAGLASAINSDPTLSGDGFAATAPSATLTITPFGTVGSVTMTYTKGSNTEILSSPVATATRGSAVCNGGMFYAGALAGAVSYDDVSTTVPQGIATNVASKVDMTLTWSSVSGGQVAVGNQGSVEVH